MTQSEKPFFALILWRISSLAYCPRLLSIPISFITKLLSNAHWFWLFLTLLKSQTFTFIVLLFPAFSQFTTTLFEYIFQIHFNKLFFVLVLTSFVIQLSLGNWSQESDQWSTHNSTHFDGLFSDMITDWPPLTTI